LLDDAAAEQGEGALRHGFAYGTRYGCVDGGLGFRVAVGCSPGILQDAHQQLALTRSQDSLILDQGFRKGIENLFAGH
jgi:hypothetical protein